MLRHLLACVRRATARRTTVLGLALGLAALTGEAGSAGAASVSRVFNGDGSAATFLLKGPIVAGDLGRLQDQTAKVPAGQRIVLLLESNGGNIEEGLAIGRYVYTARITTVTIQGPGCHSSCSFIFLAGRDIHTSSPMRILFKGGQLGFHQGRMGSIDGKGSYTADDVHAATQFGQEMVRRINDYFREINADPEFLTLTLSAPNNRITLLNEIDALRLGIYVMDTTTKRLMTPDQLRQPARPAKR